MDRIRSTIREVANDFSEPARSTILFENFDKHVLELELILTALPEDGRLLDLGGGVGFNLLCLRRMLPRAKLVLVDRMTEYVSDNCMGQEADALRLLEAAEVDVQRVDFWPMFTSGFNTGHFHVTTCLNVIEHLPGHPLEQLRELVRITDRNGTVILAGPNAISLMKRAKLLLGIHPYMDFKDWTSGSYFDHFREYTASEYAQLLRISGAEVGKILLSHAVPRTRARHHFYDGKHSPWSTTAFRLHLISLLEALAPWLRHSVYVVGSPAKINVETRRTAQVHDRRSCTE